MVYGLGFMVYGLGFSGGKIRGLMLNYQEVVNMLLSNFFVAFGGRQAVMD